ncbi:MAG: hypothetical protein B9S29_03115 [Opitutia bacterium Tous-C2FEB]|jgi:hypothetical protein|nr:MAG: hypothetical protein B9S29_03115 [Opitutae bacterium Tous-C2FEB]PAZ03335.1 MAG: hypothetical protein CAK89_01950 [Opitutae bacterium AMD-G3]
MSPAAETTTTVRPETAEETSVQPREPVVVHVRVPAYTTEMVRVWQSTFLLDRDSNHTSRLVSFEKISLYPHWTKIDYTRPYVFTLVFEGLPKSVRSFDLAEIIPDPNGFRIEAIARRPGDVYEVDVAF